MNYGMNFNVMNARSAQTLIWMNAEEGLYQTICRCPNLNEAIPNDLGSILQLLHEGWGETQLPWKRYFKLNNDNDNNQANFSDTYFGEYQYQTALGCDRNGRYEVDGGSCRSIR